MWKCARFLEVSYLWGEGEYTSLVGSNNPQITNFLSLFDVRTYIPCVMMMIMCYKKKPFIEMASYIPSFTHA